MRWTDVRSVMDALTERGVTFWVAGGWGIAALVGRQTREHRDLDLLVDAADLDACLAVLADAGYLPDTDELPVRIELAAGAGRRVDIHPVVLDDAGHGVQAGPAGSSYDYPAQAFTLGHIRDRDVPCLTAAHQRLVHDGYPHREQDRHDLAQLARIAP
ncbi:MAG: lincomycin resistance protein LmrB [Nocardioidaceae bacterium]